MPHSSPPSDFKTSEECQSFSDMMATYFNKKVRDIKNKINVTLNVLSPSPMMSDKPGIVVVHTGHSRRCASIAPHDVQEVVSTRLHSDVATQVVRRCFRTNRRPPRQYVVHIYFPSKFITAQTTPLIKRHRLDETDFSSYRPISNLNTICQMIERLFLARLLPHVARSPNYNSLQPAYRKLHSRRRLCLRS